ncbi:MAG TPA: DUF6159 family protein [Solirubrobacterales bacterium]|nr:DUF6159 family protein [Solirubrobacterales bacterium]
MRRFRIGWDLTKKSWSLLRERPGLSAFPIVGGLLALLATVAVAGPGLYLLDTESQVPGAILVALGLYLASLVSTYFAVGLAAAADRAFRGEEVSLADGLAVSRRRFGAIAGWAFVSTVVGLLISALQSQRGLAGPIVGALGGAAWGLITFLAVPVIALEGTGPIETIRRSASLFRERWRGQVTGNVAIGGAVTLLGVLPGVLLTIAGIALWTSDGNGGETAAGMFLVLAGVTLFTVSSVVAHALKQLFGVALYRYTADNEVVAGFTENELASAVRTR